LAAKFGDVKLIERPGLGEALVLTVGSDQQKPGKGGTGGATSETVEDPDAVGVTDATEVFCAS